MPVKSPLKTMSNTCETCALFHGILHTVHSFHRVHSRSVRSFKVAEHSFSGWPAVLCNTALLPKIKTNMVAKSAAKIFL